MQIALPINEGQVDYKDVLKAMDAPDRVVKKQLDRDSQTWKIDCNGACVDGKKGGTIWFDDATTLAPKYQLAHSNKLLGVGVWQANALPVPSNGSDPYAKQRTDMWSALAAWNGNAITDKASHSD